MQTSDQVLDLLGIDPPPRPKTIREWHEEPDDDGEFAAHRALRTVAKEQPAADQEVCPGVFNEEANWMVHCMASAMREKGTTGAMISICMLGGVVQTPGTSDDFHASAIKALRHVPRADRCLVIFRQLSQFRQAVIVASYGPLPSGPDFSHVQKHLQKLAGVSILTEYTAGKLGDLMAHCAALSSPRPIEQAGETVALFQQRIASHNGQNKKARKYVREARERARHEATEAHRDWERISRTVPFPPRRPATDPVGTLIDLLKEDVD